MAGDDTLIPFSISCRVPGGVAAARLEDIGLDGILAHVAVKAELGEAFYEPGHLVIEPDLPLARRGTGAAWYWACSWAQGEIEARDIHYWHRRFDEGFSRRIDFGGRRGKVITEGGPMRDMRGALSILYPERITWFALGDPATVFAMVREIPFIGKMHGQGQGRAHWDPPTRLEEDRSVWDGSRLMRSIPAAEAEEIGGQYEYEYRSLRPPYHDVATRQLCAVRSHAG